jgi:heme exporter protein B
MSTLTHGTSTAADGPSGPSAAGEDAPRPAGAGGSTRADAHGGARRAPGFMATLRTLLRKELLVELRTLQSLPGMTLFAVTAFVVFHFALNRSSVEGDLAAGLLWVTLLLASLLGINRLFLADAEQGGLEAFMLAPAQPAALLAAKALSLTAYMLALELVAVPAFALLLLGPPLWPALGGLVLALVLADAGVAAIGTLISALTVRTRARDLLGPLLSLPLLIPVVIGASSAISPLFAPRAPAFGHWLTGAGGRWLAALALYDLVFGLIAYAVFDFLLED